MRIYSKIIKERKLSFLIFIFPIFLKLLTAQSIPDKYIIDTVREPIFDLLCLDKSHTINTDSLIKSGILDVTSSPYNADPSGKKDATQSIQSAIDDACRWQMVCYFPAGTYMVTNTLSCIQPFYRRQNGKLFPSRRNPCVLFGSSKDSSKRATIKLSPSLPGFNNPAIPKYIVYFWSRSHEGIENEYPPSGNALINALFVNIDIIVGHDNDGAVGIRMRGAQGSSIQDVTIDATYGLKGIEGGAGSGGSHHHVTIIGGEIGADFSEAQPAPTISGFIFSNQRKHALFYSGMETLSIVGCSFKKESAEPIVIGCGGKIVQQGLITMMDCELSFPDSVSTGIAVQSDRSIYMRNVYIYNSSILLDTPLKKIQGSVSWSCVKELALGIDPPPYQDQQFITAAVLNGEKTFDYRDITAQTPPADLINRHIWQQIISWETAGAANVREKYAARGDGIADDTRALQKAIDENEFVFIPRGIFCVSRTLKLKRNTKMIGLSQGFSIIAAKAGEEYFNDSGNPHPLIETSGETTADTRMLFLGIYAPEEMPGVSYLLWRSGGNSEIRSCNGFRQPSVGYGTAIPEYEKHRSPLTIISGNGGGKWYNWYMESHNWSREDDLTDYRLILISNTFQSLAFYHLNCEGSESFSRIEINHSQNIDIYGLKSEGNKLVLWAHDSKNVRLFGYGGNASALPGSSLFRFERCADYLIANAMPRPALPGKKLLGSSETRDPNTWQLIIDTEAADGGTRPMERPAVYRKGCK